MTILSIVKLCMKTSAHTEVTLEPRIFLFSSVENPCDLLLWGLISSVIFPLFLNILSLLYTVDPDNYYSHDQLDPVTKSAWGNLSTFQILLIPIEMIFACENLLKNLTMP